MGDIQPASTGGSLYIDDDLELFNQIRVNVQNKLVEDDDEYAKVNTALQKDKRRVLLPLSFLNTIAANFASRLLNDPFTLLPPTETALCDVARNIGSLRTDTAQDFVSMKQREQRFALKVGFTGWFGANGVTPRGLNARLANRMVCVEGIVTRCSLVNPKLTHATFFIPELQRHFFREHTDSIAIGPPGKQGSGPVNNIIKDSEGHTVELEYGLSFYKDSQRLTLQEMPEITPTGQLPRSVELVCEDDLVDAAKPGDRIRVYGVLRAFAAKDSQVISGFARTLLVANNIELLHQDKRSPQVTPANIKQFKEVANRDDTLELVAASLAPSISGHDKVKKGLALQLVGGEGKVIEGDGSRLRGDIHILLVGDPSCGKSQMLRFMLHLAPLALSTTGRGSSAVGLTAAVVSDSETGERRLEAGAMVLADGGLVCIDEFDKMSHDDRVAVHEVMEQQRVSINKAGISATLNARTSVLAAANPIYGLFDDKIEFSKQVNFPDSLLSRFDLIYLIRESGSVEQDRRISSQVLAQMRVPHDDSAVSGLIPGQRSNQQNARPTNVYGAAGRVGTSTALTTLQPSISNPKAVSGRAVSIWTRLPAHVADAQGERRRGAGKLGAHAAAPKVLSVDFLRKYIQYCRTQINPELSDDASEEIAEFYAKIRERLHREACGSDTTGKRANHAKAIPTPRLLEACVRLATAHAKLKMRTVVEIADVVEAKKLLLYTMCGEEDVEREETRREDPDDRPLLSAKPKGGRTPIRARTDEAEVESAMKDLSISQSKKRRRDPADAQIVPASPTLAEEKVQLLNDCIAFVEAKHGEQDWSSQYLLKVVNKKIAKDGKVPFTPEDFNIALQQLQRRNRLMIVSDRVFLV